VGRGEKVGRNLCERRGHDVVSSMLWSLTVAGCLWCFSPQSPVAEPHWVAPLYLALRSTWRSDMCERHAAIRRGRVDGPSLRSALASA
jgi:hypothetical protein